MGEVLGRTQAKAGGTMKKKILLTLLIISYFLTGCYTYKPLRISSNQLKDFTKVELPIFFEHAGCRSMPYFYIQIKTNKIPISLDTGSSQAVISLPGYMVKQMNVKYTGESSRTMDVHSRLRTKRHFTIPKIKLGNLVLTNIPGINANRRHGNRGLTGLPFIRNFNVFLDYKSRKMILYNKKVYPAYLKNGKWKSIYFVEDSRKNIILQTKIGFKGKKYNAQFVLDTGCILTYKNKSYGLIIYQSNFTDLVLNDRLKQYVKNNTFANKRGKYPKKSVYWKEDNIQIDGIHFGPMSFVFINLFTPCDGLLGHNFFIKHAVFIDFTNKKLYVK